MVRDVTALGHILVRVHKQTTMNRHKKAILFIFSFLSLNKYVTSSKMWTFTPKTTTTLVVGATGATGKHVVLQLLQQKQQVRAIARSKQRLLDALDSIVPNASSDFGDKLEVTEAAILDLSDNELNQATSGCDAVVVCLGHNLTFKGMYGHPRQLVTDSVKRLWSAIDANKSDSLTKFILMGSNGVDNPSGEDDVRGFGERSVLSLLRHLVPPHKDNEMAADFVSSKVKSKQIEWTVVRPTDLVNEPVSKYELFSKPHGSLFGSGQASRANVANAMVGLILANDLWEEWKFKMPVIHDSK